MDRILNVVFGMHYGGTEAFILNMWKNIDKKNFCFDYLYFTDNDCPRDQELLLSNSHIYRVKAPKFLSQLKIVFNVYFIVRKNNFKIVHSHINELNSLVMVGAFLGGAKVRIAHMHFPFDFQNLNFVRKTYRKFQVKLIEYFSTKVLYCSKATYDSYHFSEKTDLKALLFNNTIDVSKFISASSEKFEYDKNFSIPLDNKIITNITRFDKSKNQKFIVEVFNEILKTDKNVTLLLGGEGVEKQNIINLVKQLGIEDKVRFIGVRNDVDKILKITDLYLFPSIEEGFGIVVLEAQASGTPIVCSTGVPKTTDVELNLAHYLKLDKGAQYWAQFAQNILNSKRHLFSEDQIINSFKKCGYDEGDQANRLEKIYKNE